MSKSDYLLYFPKEKFSRRFGDNFFTVDIVGYHAVKSLNTFCCPIDIIYFHLQVQKGEKMWLLDKRFSEFHKLWQELPLSAKFRLSNTFPKKTWFNVSMDPNFQTSRMKDIIKTLDGVLKDLSHNNCLKSNNLINFLQLDRPK
jgi:hypothetical protein